MQVGYARTSTEEQVAGLEAQIRDLKAAGCEEVFSEQSQPWGIGRSLIVCSSSCARAIR